MPPELKARCIMNNIAICNVSINLHVVGDVFKLFSTFKAAN
jgi:hypothetical protein